MGKRNANLVRSVELLKDLFPNEYTEKQRTGNNGQLVKVYEMTHAGFNFLVRKFRDTNPGMVDIFNKCFDVQAIMRETEHKRLFDGEENDETSENNDEQPVFP